MSEESLFSVDSHIVRSMRVGRASGVTAAAALVGVLSACGGSSSGDSTAADTAASEGASLHGAVLQPANPEPALTLTDTSGASYDVPARGAGKVTLVYFGYTHCPDVCPTTMADIAQALRTVSPPVRQQVVVAFVSVDPTRDRRSVIRHWLDQFNPAFVGLRGTLPQVIEAQRNARLPISRVSKNGRKIEHAAQVIAYTPDSMEHVFYTEGPSTIEDLEHDLPILVTGKGFGA